MTYALSFKRVDENRGGRPKRYSEEDFDLMEAMRDEGKSFDEIGLIFGVKGKTIENLYYENISDKRDQTLRAPSFDGWDFSKDNVECAA